MENTLDVEFDINELNRAINECKNTAPGEVQICYIMFKHVSIV